MYYQHIHELTKKQIAQKRNWFLYVLTGLHKPVDYNALSGREIALWEKILEHRKTLIEEFEQTSEKKGLVIKDKSSWEE